MWNDLSVKPEFPRRLFSNLPPQLGNLPAAIRRTAIRAGDLRTKRWGLVAIVCLVWQIPAIDRTLAGDCGCEATCGSEAPTCGVKTPSFGCSISVSILPTLGAQDGCDGTCDRHKKNLIYQSLDAVAGGIEKLFLLDRYQQNRRGDCGCSNHHSETCRALPMAPMVHHPTPAETSHRPMPQPIVMQHEHHRENGSSDASIMARPRPGQVKPRPLSDPTFQWPPTPTTTRPGTGPANPFLDDEVHVRPIPKIMTTGYETTSASPPQSVRRSRQGSPRQRTLSTSGRISSRRTIDR